jgi:hypothetical protein
MNYKSKRTLVILITGLALMVGYAVYALGSAAPMGTDIKAWALMMLVFIGAFVAAQALVQVLFHIALAAEIAVRRRTTADGTVEAEMDSLSVEDEMDTRIGLKASSAAYALTALSLPAGLICLALGAPMVAGLHVLLGGLWLGVIIHCALSMYYYERGL